MSESFDFVAPTGDEIQGTSEVTEGAAAVDFTSADGDFDHSGGTNMFWDGQVTNTIDGVPLFTCASGEDWLKHHLVPREQRNNLPCIVVEGMREELRLGYLLESLKATRSAFINLIAGRSTFFPTGYGSHQSRVDQLTGEITALEKLYRGIRGQVQKEVAMAACDGEA
jgi:hypothetical protein